MEHLNLRAPRLALLTTRELENAPTHKRMKQEANRLRLSLTPLLPEQLGLIVDSRGPAIQYQGPSVQKLPF